MEYRIGIDLGGTFSKLGLVSFEGGLLACRRLPAVPGCDPRAAMREAAGTLRAMAEGLGLPFPSPHGCGIGVPAFIDYAAGRVRFSGPLGWSDVDLARIAADELGCETFLDIDVNAGALADLYFGCACDARDLIYLSWGTGIGAGFVVGRKLYHSRGGTMGNFGHMPADPASDRLCYCGCRGCLEIEAGGRALCTQARERLLRGEESILAAGDITPAAIANAAAAGDTLSIEILERAIRLIARSLAGVLSFLNPDTVVFGGGVSGCLALLQGVFDEELRRSTPRVSLPLTRIVRSSFGENAGVIGAAMLPADRNYKGPCLS